MARATVDLLRQLIELAGGVPCTPPFAPLSRGYLLDLLELNAEQQEQLAKALAKPT